MMKQKLFLGIAISFCLGWMVSVSFAQTAVGRPAAIRPAATIQSSGSTKAIRLAPGTAIQSPSIQQGVQLPGGPDGMPGQPGAASKARPKKVSPEEQKVQRAMTLQFNRSPGSILKTWSKVNNPEIKKVRPEPPGPDDPKEILAKAIAKSLSDFENNVILGNWDEASKFLKSLKEKNAQKVYDLVLSKLQTIPVDTAAAVPLPANLPPGALPPGVVVPAPVAGVPADDHLIAPKDFVGLVKMAPDKLTPANITTLGMLLGKTVRQGFELNGVIAEFEKGVANIGGADAENRLNAARILLAAGKPRKASPYLKSMDKAVSENDVDAIVLNSDVAERIYNLERKPELLIEAWKNNLAVLATKGIKEADRQKALQFAVTLAPKIEEEIGESWLKKSFTEEPKRGLQILAGIGQATADGQKLNMRNTALRLEGLKLQKTAVGVLIAAAPTLAEEWNQTLNLLALNWLKEAKLSRTFARSSGRPMFRRDRYGNIYYASADELRGMVGSAASSRPLPIPVQDILDCRPENEWYAEIDGGLKNEFEELLARLYLKNADEAKAFPFIESIAKSDKKRAKRLVDEFLQVWTRNHNPNEDRGNRNQYIYFFGFEQRANSIPLTRSKQQRNLKELREWISRIRELQIEDIDEQALVRAFTTCHSSAEVYRIKDIEEVFGSLQDLEAKTVAGLVQKMRTNLSTAWRQPRVQEAKKTNRKEPEIQREVQRGYEVAAEITKEALFEHPENWQLLLAKACINFDRNAYQQEVKKSSEFTEKQRKVFGEFQEAAQCYASKVSTLDEDEQSTEVFDLWFYASLGACDLALLTHEKLSVESQFDLIRAAIDGLPGESPKSHLSQFANKLFTRMSPLKPEMKYRYLKGGFAIVGDHPDAVEAQKVFQYYNDLVTEIQLQTTIDGSDVIGTEPFGLFVNLYHTEEVERESGGFAKYLQNQNSMTYAYNYGRPTNDYRDAFESAAIAALSEHFEVISVTFEDEKNIESRESSKPGWRITPYAYILMKARGEEVDIIPPVKLDLDFLDTSGYAVLPIESKAVPVETGSGSADPRPLTDLKIIQTLDERRSGEGKLVLEVKATAKGLIPDFDKILKFKDEAFEIVEEQDQGVSVSAFDPESNDIQIVAEREWLIELRAKDDAGKPKEFEFCGLVDETSNSQFKRYIDADLVEVDRIVELENQYGSMGSGWIYWLAGGGSFAILLTVLAVLIFQAPKQETVAQYRRPEEITPLSVIGLLKQIRDDQRLADENLVKLDDSIHRIEQHFFYTSNGEVPDLEKETDHWLAIAN